LGNRGSEKASDDLERDHRWLEVNGFVREPHRDGYHRELFGIKLTLVQSNDLWWILVDSQQVGYKHKSPIHAIFQAGRYSKLAEIRKAMSADDMGL
jgi:hypothetical protein